MSEKIDLYDEKCTHGSLPLRRDACVDIVFCIDITGDMHPIIDRVKQIVIAFPERVRKYMHEMAIRDMKQLRVRVIGFRDFYDGAAPALEMTDFFTLPEEQEKFESFVNSLEAKGGGDIPENSLEALALAMQSDWTKKEPNVLTRHVIMLFTGASAHPLEDAATREKVQEYPENMPESYQELLDMWYGQGKGVTTFDQNAKRMVVCAPADTDPWDYCQCDFGCCHFPAIEPDGGDIGCEYNSLFSWLYDTGLA